MAQFAKITFIESDGTETRSPTHTSERIRYAFTGREPLECSFSDFPSEIKEIAFRHGIKQKLSDAYADAKGDVDLAAGLVDALADRLITSKQWNLKGEGIGRETLLAKAMAEVTGQELAKVIAKLEGKTKAEKTAFRQHPQVAPVIARMEKERAEEKLKKLRDAVPDDVTPLSI